MDKQNNIDILQLIYSNLQEINIEKKSFNETLKNRVIVTKDRRKKQKEVKNGR